jgi:hypothetical protein
LCEEKQNHGTGQLWLDLLRIEKRSGHAGGAVARYLPCAGIAVRRRTLVNDFMECSAFEQAADFRVAGRC